MSEQSEKFDPNGYYEALELTYKASQDEIKHNYRNIAKIWHPDQNSSEEALEKFQKISVAYDILKDDKKKIVYDILAQVYVKENFPDMFSLKIYKNIEGREDLFVRSIRQKKVIGKIIKYSAKDEVEICSFSEAKSFVLKTSFSNWLLGWWSLKSFGLNIKAIVDNIKIINENKHDNLRLLVHNAVAYWQEDKNDKALFSVIEANEYANQQQKELLAKLAEQIGGKAKKRSSPWNYGMLKLLQLIFPFIIALVVLLSLSTKMISLEDFNSGKGKGKEINYYQEVQFSATGRGRTFNDVVVGKILDIPVDIKDPDLLFNVSKNTKVMYAPGDDFDVMTTVEAKTTVRVTGYTPDKVWFRVMLDGGEMGFVRREVLKKGVGKEIPEDSKIYAKPF